MSMFSLGILILEFLGNEIEASFKMLEKKRGTFTVNIIQTAFSTHIELSKCNLLRVVFIFKSDTYQMFL